MLERPRKFGIELADSISMGLLINHADNKSREGLDQIRTLWLIVYNPPNRQSTAKLAARNYYTENKQAFNNPISFTTR